MRTKVRSRRVLLSVLIVFVSTFSFYSLKEKALAATKSRFERLELFTKVLHLIESQYYRQVDTDKLIQGALKGMMSTLDPHSSFLDKEVFAKMQEDTSGEFGGLGLEVQQKEGTLVVITPIEDTPAFQAGLQAGDKIVEINHEPTIGITLEEAVDKMRGKPGSKISIGIVRDGVDGVKTYDLIRKKIQIKPVKSQLVSNNYLYIRLLHFQQRSASSIIDDLKSYKKTAAKNGGIKGVIIDLRANPGGLLDEAVDVSSIFLKDGVVVSTEGRDPKNKEIRYVKKTGYKDLETPLVVLINGASASASEIVAGALQDHRRAVIMGSDSFGKGSVQTVVKIDEDKGLKLTIAQYMTPQGRKIQALGIKPDIFLREFQGDWDTSESVDSPYIREIDLRNHLTATIETEDEKKERLKKEKRERMARIKRIKERRENDKKKKSEDKVENYDPTTDYQVIQAVKFIEGLKVFKKLDIKS